MCMEKQEIAWLFNLNMRLKSIRFKQRLPIGGLFHIYCRVIASLPEFVYRI